MPPIRVAIVEDQTIVRQGLRGLLALNADFAVVAEASDGIEALEVIVREKPDVILLDLRMPRLDGVGVLKELRVRGIATPALILTTFEDVSLERLTSAIRTVAAGGTCIEPVITERIMRALERSNVSFDSAELPEPLTDREKTILRLLAGGYSNKEISELLDISDGTVKNHISSVLSKLGVRDRTRAVLKAIDLGLI
jgi:DNA-binding NarL/FixJ family response regulator